MKPTTKLITYYKTNHSETNNLIKYQEIIKYSYMLESSVTFLNMLQDTSNYYNVNYAITELKDIGIVVFLRYPIESEVRLQTL